MRSMRFGLNTDIFETNILNLAVVVGIVVVVVGDSLETVLNERRRMILSALDEVDQNKRDAQIRLEEAKKAVEVARLQAKDTRVEAEVTIRKQRELEEQLKDTRLKQIQDNKNQEIRLRRQQVINSVTRRVVEQAISERETKLIERFLRRDEEAFRAAQILNEQYLKSLSCTKVRGRSN